MTGTGEIELGGLLAASDRARPAVELAVLVEEHGATLFRVAHSILRSRSDAEDVVQDTFVRVLEHRRTLPQVRDLRVWLVRIAWNLALDRRRRSKPEQMDASFAATLAAKLVPADEALGEAQALTALLLAIEKLPRRERQVLLLSAIDGLTTAEVAQVIGKSESGTRALLFRARARLKERTKGGRR